MQTARSGREMLGLLDLAKHASDEQMQKIMWKLAFDGFRNLVDLTPWKTGRARAGWQVSLNGAPDASEYSPAVKGQVFPSSSFSLQKFKTGDVIHLYNNVFYIQFLDKGSSKQARAGMTEPTRDKLAAQAERILKILSIKKIDV